jgi:regulator of sirC expression with transglutaminase-like and TPR domain
VSPEALARVRKMLPKEQGERPAAALVERLTPDAAVSVAILREQAKRLEQQAARARQLAAAVHKRSVQGELTRVLRGKEEEIDLIHAALLVARLDNEDVEVASYRKEVERMADKVRASLARDADDRAKLAAMNKYLFEERGFHGSVGDYYNRSNSYLSEVIDDREGIPITLSVLYLELGRRLGVRLEGVGLPGHFVVRHLPARGKPQLIDVYEGGKPMSREQAENKVASLSERPLREEDLAAVKKRDIVVRILHNLLNVARTERDTPGLLRYLDAILTLRPDALRERNLRLGLRAQQGDRAGALEDIDWLIEHGDEDIDVEQLRKLRRLFVDPPRGDGK